MNIVKMVREYCKIVCSFFFAESVKFVPELFISYCSGVKLICDRKFGSLITDF